MRKERVILMNVNSFDVNIHAQGVLINLLFGWEIDHKTAQGIISYKLLCL